jgi:undecaprenyl-diphosphatase
LDILKCVTLGIVQGLTEFLPVSSSAHLHIVPALLGWPDPGTTVTAVLQLGTVAAVLAYFASDIRHTLSGMIRAFRPGGDRNSPEARLGIAVLLGTLPICVIGLALKKYIEGPLRSLYITATMLIVMAAILLLAEMMAKKKDGRPLVHVTMRDGLLVGLAQALALVPGVSRSGATLTGAFMTGLNREAAVRFSFLLSIPAVLLSGLLELKEFIRPAPPVPGAHPTMHLTSAELAVATIVSAIVGYASIAWLMTYLQRNSTTVFAVYRVILGILLFYLLSTGRIAAL